MFKNHMPEIKRYAMHSPENLADVVLMVSLSIQQPWHTVGTQIRDVRINGSSSKYLWGIKRKTYEYLQSNKTELYNNYIRILRNRSPSIYKARQMLDAFMDVPGLGLVKSGFCCQLTAGLVGCIDLHNIRIYGIEPSTLKVSKSMSAKLIRSKQIDYIDVCHRIGTQKLWDKWCEHLASNSKHFTSGFEVSKVHYDYLALEA